MPEWEAFDFDKVLNKMGTLPHSQKEPGFRHYTELSYSVGKNNTPNFHLEQFMPPGNYRCSGYLLDI